MYRTERSLRTGQAIRSYARIRRLYGARISSFEDGASLMRITYVLPRAAASGSFLACLKPGSFIIPWVTNLFPDQLTMLRADLKAILIAQAALIATAISNLPPLIKIQKALSTAAVSKAAANAISPSILSPLHLSIPAYFRSRLRTGI